MIKLQALQDFTLERFNELKNIERYRKDQKGKIFEYDKFECDQQLADYLLGNNPLNKTVAKVVEYKPETKGSIEYSEDPIQPKAEFKSKKSSKKKK